MELLSWAYKKTNRFIIEDDYDVEFRFTGKVLAPLMSMDTKERVIYMNTFSKTLSPAFRISYMVLPKSMINTFSKNLGFTTCQVSALEQLALADFISQGYYEKHLNRMKNFYKGIRDYLILAIQKSPLNKVATIEEKEAGLHFLMKIQTKKSAAVLKKSLEENGVKISLLDEYYYNNGEKKRTQKTFIVNYSGLERSKIQEAVAALNRALL